MYWHVTNTQQDWDVPHGFTVKGSNSAELLVMPGETMTLKSEPKSTGVFPFYCTDFCSALGPGDAGICKSFSGRIGYTTDLEPG